MWASLQRYRALEPQARKLFWSATALLVSIRASLRMRGYGKTQKWLQRRAESHRKTLTQEGQSATRHYVELACRMVKSAGYHGEMHASCLEESLALWYLLRVAGLQPKVRIGVRKSSGNFEAHAWIELDGSPLNEPEQNHKHYAAFDAEFPDTSAEIP
jgi:Transglutaminase-like superfamily